MVTKVASLLLLVLLVSLSVWEVRSFVLPNSDRTSPCAAGRSITVLAQSSNDDDNLTERGDDDTNASRSDIGRRSILQSLLGGAVAVATVGDAATAIFSATGASASSVIGSNTALTALYRRVISFGQRNTAAVASEDLLSWISSQTTGAAATAELQTWIAAQRKLQTVRRAGGAAATAAGAAAKTASRRAAVTAGGGSLVEDVVVAAAAGKALKTVLDPTESSENEIDAVDEMNATRMEARGEDIDSINNQSESISVEKAQEREKSNSTPLDGPDKFSSDYHGYGEQFQYNVPG